MKQYQSKSISPKTGEDILAKAEEVRLSASTGIFATVGKAMMQSEKADRVAQAKHQAMVDVAKGEMQDYDDGWFKSKYGEVYDQTATTLAEKRYTEQLQSVVKKAHADNIGNPSGFQASVDQAVKALTPKNPTLKDMFEIKKNKLVEMENLAVTKEFMKKSKKDRLEALDYIKGKLSMDYINAKATKNKLGMEDAVLKYKQELTNNGAAGYALKEQLYSFRLEAISTEAVREVNNIVKHGISFEKLQEDIFNLDGIMEEDKNDLIQDLSKRYNAIIDLNNKQADQVELNKKREQEQNYNTILYDTILGNIGKESLIEMVGTQDISYEQYRQLQKSISEENINSIDSEILQHAIAYPSTIDVDAVMKSTALSNESKEKILNKVRTMPKWTTGINYKQGLQEIYTKFNVDMNALVVIEKGSDYSGLGAVTKAYHDIMEKVPADQKETVAKQVSRKLINKWTALGDSITNVEAFNEASRKIGMEEIEKNPTSIPMHQFFKGNR